MQINSRTFRRKFLAPDSVNTTTKKFNLPLGAVVEAVGLSIDTAGGPIYVTARLRTEGSDTLNIILFGDWISYDGKTGGNISLKWHGHLTVPTELPAILFVTAYNITGNDREVDVTWVIIYD